MYFNSKLWPVKEETDVGNQRERGKKEEVLKKTDYTNPHSMMRQKVQEQRWRNQGAQ